MGFLGSMPILILESKKILISDISAECGYQILVMNICYGEKISYILFQMLVHSEHFAY